MGIYTKKPSPSREHRNVHQKGQKKTSKHAFLMIHHQHLMVCLQFFPSFSFCLLLSTFCQISSAGPSCGLCLAFRLQYSPKARASSIIFLCVSPTLVCLLPSWGPKSSLSCHLRPAFPLLFLLPSSKDQTLAPPSHKK